MIVLGTVSLMFFFTTSKYEDMSFLIVEISVISLFVGCTVNLIVFGG